MRWARISSILCLSSSNFLRSCARSGVWGEEDRARIRHGRWELCPAVPRRSWALPSVPMPRWGAQHCLPLASALGNGLDAASSQTGLQAQAAVEKTACLSHHRKAQRNKEALGSLPPPSPRCPLPLLKVKEGGSGVRGAPGDTFPSSSPPRQSDWREGWEEGGRHPQTATEFRWQLWSPDDRVRGEGGAWSPVEGSLLSGEPRVDDSRSRGAAGGVGSVGRSRKAGGTAV